MLLAAATAAAPDHSCPPFPSSRRPAPPGSLLFARRAAGSSSGLSLRRHGLSCHCRCHASWNNEHERRSRSSSVLHCRAVASAPDRMDELPARARYHPFEEIAETLLDDGEPTHLTDAESARTIVEVNSKATVMISTLVGDGVHDRIIMPEFLRRERRYLLRGRQRRCAAGVWRTSWARTRSRMSSSGWITTHRFSPTWILQRPPMISHTKMTRTRRTTPDDEETDFDDDFNDVAGVFAIDDDEEDEGEDDDDDDMPNWSNLETVNSCHPLYFARMIVEVMNQRKTKKESGATFSKVEVLSIELITAYGTEPKLKIGEYRKAKPDIIAHSASNIISRLRAGGDNITQALKLTGRPTARGEGRSRRTSGFLD